MGLLAHTRALSVAAAVTALALAGCGGGSSRGASQTTGSGGAAAASHQSAAADAASGATAEASELRRLAALGLPVYCGGRRGNMVALTFDDGPGPYTRLAIRKLRAHHDRATFFV